MWIAVDIDGSVYMYTQKPIRTVECWMPALEDNNEPIEVNRSKAKAVAGRVLEWKDEPIKLNKNA